MAKKAAKKKTVIKKTAKAISPVPDTAAVKKSGSNYMKIIMVSSLIFVCALVFGIVYSQIRSTQLEKAAVAPAVAPTVIPAAAATIAVSSVSPSSIQVKDPATNKTYKMDIKPASVSQSQSVQPAAPQAAVAVPVESPTSTNIPVRCKIYFKDIDVKANIHRMDIEDAEYLYDSGKALFIDARGPNEFAEAHIKGAINIPVNTTPNELEKMKSQLQGKLLVTYCHGVGCHLSDKTAYLLFDAGYRKIGIFFGGWPKWNEHKYPIETKAQPTPAK